MRKSFQILMMLGILSLLLPACDTDAVNPEETFVYAETLCADPWASAQDDGQLIQNIENYLNEQGVTYAEVKITGNRDAITCQACTCHTGRAIEVKAAADQRNLLESLGFD